MAEFNKLAILILTFCLFVLIGAKSFAAPITWTVDAQIEFRDFDTRPVIGPGTVTGSFQFDNDTGEVTNVNLIADGKPNTSGTYSLGIARKVGFDSFVSINFFQNALPGSADLTGAPHLVIERNVRPIAGRPEVLFTQESAEAYGGTFRLGQTSLGPDNKVIHDYEARLSAWTCLTADCFTSLGASSSPTGTITPDLAPKLFLDFSNPLQREFSVKTNLITGKQHIADRPGSMPKALFTDDQKSQIVSGVQEVFNRSGINIVATDQKPEGDFVTVRFAPPIEPYDGDGDGEATNRLVGKAFDIMPRSVFGRNIDRFDRRKDGTVAVFRDGSDAISRIVETIVHEAAHAYGGRHVNPFENNGNEVLDYSPGAFPKFVDFKTSIVEPPVDGQPADSETHNPTYHIRRYAVGEDPDDLFIGESLVPGTWDTKGFRLFGLDFEFSLDQIISDFRIGFPTNATGIEEDLDDSGFSSFSLQEVLVDGDRLSFTLMDDVSFQLFGSSSDGSIMDIFLGIGEIENPVIQFGIEDLIEADLMGLLPIIMWNREKQVFQTIGEFDVSVFDLGFVNSDGSVVRSVFVSEPYTWTIFAAQMVLLAAFQAYVRRDNYKKTK